MRSANQKETGHYKIPGCDTFSRRKDAIDRIAAELKSGEDFAVTAARRSTDDATKMDGGDLGYLTAEDASPEFARVIRDVPQGGVSRPFEDAQGWHIVKVEEVRKRRPPSIEELRDRIERGFRGDD